jgi:predicted transcriptional regulator
MTYRSRTDITAQILEAANGGVTKNKIIYKAVLGYDQMNKYLMLLAKSSLVMTL